MAKAGLASSLLVLLAIGSASAASTVLPAPRGRIVFVSSRAIAGQGRLNAGKSDAFSLDLESGRSRDLSHTSGDDTGPVPSPDGKLVAFVHRSYSGQSSLWLMTRGGRARRRLVDFNDVSDNIAWSPNGAMIAFTTLTPPLTFALWVVNRDGSGLRRVAGLQADGLRWSPDGTQIAFSGRERQDSSVLEHIGVVRLDGNSVRWLTGPENLDFSPDWAPDGKQLVFVRSEGSCVCAAENLFLIRPDGTGLQQLTPYDGKTPGESIPLGAPSWSPSGDELVFTRGLTGAGPRIGFALNVIRSDGSDLRTLARDAFSPVWAPSGRRLAYAQVMFRHGSPLGVGIEVEQLGGRPQRRHLEPWPSELTGGPTWSPDGKSVFYSSVFGGRNDFELFLISPPGKRLRQLTRDAVDEFDPAWSSDGRRIAFARGTLRDDFSIKRSSLYVIDADGGHVRQITRGSRDHAPSWSPDGRQIVFSRNGSLEIVDLRTERVRVLGSCGGCAAPVWSPNGRLIAFANGTRLEAIRADGKGERTIFDGGAKLDGEVPAQISGPSWSPDGSLIAFHLLYDYGQPSAQPATEESEVLVSSTGKVRGTLSCHPPVPPPFPPDVRGGTSDYFAMERVSWSPSDEWLAVGGVGESRISICPTSGSDGFWLTAGLEPAWQPAEHKR